MLQSVNIMFSENVGFRKKDADVLITPAVGSVAMLDFTQKKRCMQAGIEARRRPCRRSGRRSRSGGRKAAAK